MRRVRVLVFGRVQGVFFRTTCAARAREAGLVGFVRNLPDASVEAVFEGSSPAVDEMVEWCRGGPPHAEVDRVEVTEEPPAGDDAFLVLGW